MREFGFGREKKEKTGCEGGSQPLRALVKHKNPDKIVLLSQLSG